MRPDGSVSVAFDVHVLLRKLAAKRPLFHSEADFQHALAWELHEDDPELAIRLEYPVRTQDTTIHVDIWARRSDGSILALGAC